MKALLPYIADRLEKANLRHEIHSFDSGAVMVDIWVGERIHVVQIDGDMIGLSEITEETTPFDIIPERSFKNADAFKVAFERIFV